MAAACAARRVLGRAALDPVCDIESKRQRRPCRRQPEDTDPHPAGHLNLLTTGAATQFGPAFVLPDPDTRIQNFAHLPNGPFPLQGAQLPYDSYTGDTTHRLFEMWQQSDCNIKNATRQNPSGCLSDLYPFVITNYTNQPDPFSGGAIYDNGGRNPSVLYNAQKSDAPVP